MPFEAVINGRSDETVYERARLTMHVARKRSFETEDEAASRKERNQESMAVRRSQETAIGGRQAGETPTAYGCPPL